MAKTQKQKAVLFGNQIIKLPGDLINETCLEQQISVWQQTVTDEVLIGPHRHTMAHTQRTKHLQHLEHNLSALHVAIAQ